MTFIRPRFTDATRNRSNPRRRTDGGKCSPRCKSAKTTSVSSVSHSSLPLMSEPNSSSSSSHQKAWSNSGLCTPCKSPCSTSSPWRLQPLAPGLHSRPLLSFEMDDSKLRAIHPATSHPLQTITSASDSSSVASSQGTVTSSNNASCFTQAGSSAKTS